MTSVSLFLFISEIIAGKKKTVNAENVPTARKNSNTDYLELKNALLDLTSYIDRLSNHSNNELRDLTKKIRALISDQD